MPWRVAPTLVLTAWGALAFGAVYPWRYGCGALGRATLLQRRGAGKTDTLLAVALVLLVAARWTGFDRIATRFAGNGTADIGGQDPTLKGMHRAE